VSDTSTPRDPEPAAATVLAAQGGDATALEALVVAVRDRVYRLSLRMTAHPPDAEDATQEILIKVITRLSMFRGDAAFSTWVHRIAVNHLLDRSKSAVERTEMTFDAYAADLLDGLSASPSSAPDAAVLEREVQLACTHAMLTCLDRQDRIAYILGDIFGVDSEEGGYICEIPAATYRKRLSRARGRVREFLAANCGLVSEAAACRCAKRVDVAVRVGRIDPHQLRFTDVTATVTDELVQLYDAAQLLRSVPDAKIPEGSVQVIKRLIQNSVAISDCRGSSNVDDGDLRE
jgi:RNA polymerase sigma factor (sigma-70 family)